MVSSWRQGLSTSAATRGWDDGPGSQSRMWSGKPIANCGILLRLQLACIPVPKLVERLARETSGGWSLACLNWE